MLMVAAWSPTFMTCTPVQLPKLFAITSGTATRVAASSRAMPEYSSRFSADSSNTVTAISPLDACTLAENRVSAGGPGASCCLKTFAASAGILTSRSIARLEPRPSGLGTM
jgi:hypothetical protein